MALFHRKSDNAGVSGAKAAGAKNSSPGNKAGVLGRDLHRMKLEKIAGSLIFILLGIVLFIWPAAAMDTLSRVIGAVLVCGGVVAVLLFFFNKERGFASSAVLILGVIIAVIGYWIFTHPAFLTDLVPVITGLIIIISGIVNITEAVMIARMKKDGFAPSLVLAVITVALGVMILLRPGVVARFVARVMGAVLVYNGVSDLYIISRVTGKVRQAAAEASALTVTATETTAQTLDPDAPLYEDFHPSQEAEGGAQEPAGSSGPTAQAEGSIFDGRDD